MDLAAAAPLTDEELVRLTFLEAVIDRGQYQFLAVGDALRQIKDGKLWRHTHRSFEDYCEDRWSFSSNYARRLLKARDVMGVLPPETEVLPENERQARALLAVPEERRAQVWSEAVKRGGDALRASRLVPEVFKALTAEEQSAIRAEAKKSTAGHTAGLRKSASNEWYTPTVYINAVKKMFGGSIDLDPASCEDAQAYVRANRYYTQKENGLSLDWKAASVFCNPPYGAVEKGGTTVKHWVVKALQEYESGNSDQVILLVNSFTSSGWFKPLWDHTLCFVDKRIQFVSPTQAGAVQPTHGNVFVYLGKNVERFSALFSTHGAVVQRYKQEEF